MCIYFRLICLLLFILLPKYRSIAWYKTLSWPFSFRCSSMNSFSCWVFLCISFKIQSPSATQHTTRMSREKGKTKYQNSMELYHGGLSTRDTTSPRIESTQFYYSLFLCILLVVGAFLPFIFDLPFAFLFTECYVKRQRQIFFMYNKVSLCKSLQTKNNKFFLFCYICRVNTTFSIWNIFQCKKIFVCRIRCIFFLILFRQQYFFLSIVSCQCLVVTQFHFPASFVIQAMGVICNSKVECVEMAERTYTKGQMHEARATHRQQNGHIAIAIN